MSDNDFQARAEQPPAEQAPAEMRTAETPTGPSITHVEPRGAAPVSTARRYRGLLIGGATAIALGIGACGVGVGFGLSSLASTSAGQAIGGGSSHDGSGGSGGAGGNGGRRGTFGGPGTTSVNATPATAAQKVGVVTVVSTLDYSRAEAAGTGIILSSTGEILTNNHVVQGSTSIEVTVESTGESYTAKVVGTDATDDVAVLQLVDSNGSHVTGLTKATIDTDTLSKGDAVTSVGNAEGTGNLVAATGTVTALDQAITVANDISGDDEHLSGLIETDADVVSGDSGGPLIDAQGEVTGMVTAASSGSRAVTGYAIPITSALAIAKKIVNGEASSSIVIGLPAFLGVELATAPAGSDGRPLPGQQGGSGQGGTGQGDSGDQGGSGSGVLIGGIIAGTGAAGTGLAAGDRITAVDGTAVTTSDALRSLVTAHAVGDRVTITYTDASGATQQVVVTLTAGPAA
jgi:S1-C subfamily serine protease